MNFTFNSIITELNTRLELQNGFKKVLYFSVYQRIVDLIAYVFSRLAYTEEYLYRESSWKNAKNRSSLINQAYYLGYTPHRKIGARGSLIISGDSNFSDSYIFPGNDVFIPRWTSFSNPTGDTVYAVSNSTYFRNQTGNLTISVKEGIPKDFVYTASGVDNETITVFSDSVDSEDYDVFIVDSDLNVLATCVNTEDPFLENNLTPYFYTIEDDPNFSSVNFKFGDGIYTRKLAPNEIVLIKYAETKGSDGNIEGIESINSFVEPVIDLQGNQITLFVTNPDTISDGSDYESVQSIRSNGRRLFFAGYRAGSSNDWQTIINSHPNVLKSKIWTRADLGLPAIGFQEVVIFVSIVSRSGDQLTNEQQLDLAYNYLAPAKAPTDVVSFQTLNKIYVKYDCLITSPTGIPKNQIEGEVNTILSENFSVQQLDFNQSLYESNYTSVIDSLTNVLYHTTEAWYLEDTDLRTFPGQVRPFNYTTPQSYQIKVANVNETDPTKRVIISEKKFELSIRRKIAGVWQNPTRLGRDTGNPLNEIRGIKYISTKDFEDRSVPPTVSDDDTQGFAIDSIWREDQGSNIYVWWVCTDATTGSAVWENLNLTPEGVPTSNTDSDITGLNEGSIVYIEASGRYYECIDNTSGSATWQQRFNIEGFGNGSGDMLSYTWTVNSPNSIDYATGTITYNIQNIADDPLSNGQWGFLNPTDSVEQATGYLIYLVYRTEDQNGQQTRDVRLSEFQQILDFDEVFNTFDIRYR